MTRRHSPRTYIAKADRALATVRLNLKDKDPDGACDRAYYAMFNAAHAALFALGVEGLTKPIKTHSGLEAMFGRELVLGDLLPAEHGRNLSKVQKHREVADCSAEPVDFGDAAWSIERAEAFVEAIRRKFRL